MKRLFVLLMGILACWGALSAIPAEVNAYFLPDDAARLEALLDIFSTSIQSEVLVASYWITDQNFVDKLIEMKRQGVDVQVIFDQSSENTGELSRQLAIAGIEVLVSPFKDKMHNKFVVFGESDVWTGSANFTKTAFATAQQGANDENVVVISSREIAERYRQQFIQMKKRILEAYVDLLSQSDRQARIPSYISWLEQSLVMNSELFRSMIKGVVPKLSQGQRIAFADRVPMMSPHILCTEDDQLRQSNLVVEDESYLDESSDDEPPTRKQWIILQEAGYNPEDIGKKEAVRIIGEYFKQQKKKRARYK